MVEVDEGAGARLREGRGRAGGRRAAQVDELVCAGATAGERRDAQAAAQRPEPRQPPHCAALARQVRLPQEHKCNVIRCLPSKTYALAFHASP